MKVTHVAWLNGGRIGVIRDEDPYEKVRYHIKAIDNQCVDIYTEAHDVMEVAHWGHQIHNDIGELIIERYGKPYEMEVR